MKHVKMNTTSCFQCRHSFCTYISSSLQLVQLVRQISLDDLILVISLLELSSFELIILKNLVPFVEGSCILIDLTRNSLQHYFSLLNVAFNSDRSGSHGRNNLRGNDERWSTAGRKGSLSSCGGGIGSSATQKRKLQKKKNNKEMYSVVVRTGNIVSVPVWYAKLLYPGGQPTALQKTGVNIPAIADTFNDECHDTEKHRQSVGVVGAGREIQKQS